MEATVIENTRRDPRFRRSPLVRQSPFVRSYAGVPLLTPDSCVIGALSVMDLRQRRFTIEQIDVLRVLARQAVTQLELRRQTTLLSTANAKLQTLATSDSLTGLKNVRAFREDLASEILYAKRNGTPVSLIMLDVDNFKAYNDEFGHPAGDDILRAVSILLIDSSREYDFIARYGGEEFAMILRDADPAEAFAVAERLRGNIAGAKWPDRKITASIGISTFSKHLNTRDLMISEADQMLYLSKTTGKNRVSQSSHDDEGNAPKPLGYFSRV